MTEDSTPKEPEVTAEVHIRFDASGRVAVTSSHEGPIVLGFLEIAKAEVVSSMKREPRIVVPRVH